MLACISVVFAISLLAAILGLSGIFMSALELLLIALPLQLVATHYFKPPSLY